MKKILFGFVLVSTLFLAGCSSEDVESDTVESSQQTTETTMKAPKILRMSLLLKKKRLKLMRAQEKKLTAKRMSKLLMNWKHNLKNYLIRTLI